MTIRKRRTNAEQAVLDAIPEYRDAVAIGEAKRLLKEKAAGGRERRLMAFLFHHDFPVSELAHLFAVSPATVEHHLAEWKRLAGLTDPSLGIRARRAAGPAAPATREQCQPIPSDDGATPAETG